MSDAKVSKRSKSLTIDGVAYESKTAAIKGLATLGVKTKTEIAAAVGAHYSMVVTTINKAGITGVPLAAKGRKASDTPAAPKAKKVAKGKAAKAPKAKKAAKVDNKVESIVGDIPADVKADMVADGIMAEGDELPLGDALGDEGEDALA
jgi:hypothetical protein